MKKPAIAVAALSAVVGVASSAGCPGFLGTTGGGSSPSPSGSGGSGAPTSPSPSGGIAASPSPMPTSSAGGSASPSPSPSASGGGTASTQGFVLIQAGTFTMGSPTDEPGRSSDETQHQVTLTRSFYMQTTEVTQGQWKSLMGNNPSYFKNAGDAAPVEQVNWWEAAKYANAMSASESLAPCYTFTGCTGTAGTNLDCSGGSVTVNGSDGTPYTCAGYRLPTEAEWEYAYRAGTTTAFYNGPITQTGYDPVDPKLTLIGWYWGNSDVTYQGGYASDGRTRGTHPAGQKQANAWGLYDMAGNVWEWNGDWYASYPSGSATDPTGPQSGSYRVTRGGSWGSDAQIARAAYRFNFYPDIRYFFLGFRLARSRQP